MYRVWWKIEDLERLHRGSNVQVSKDEINWVQRGLKQHNVFTGLYSKPFEHSWAGCACPNSKRSHSYLICATGVWLCIILIPTSGSMIMSFAEFWRAFYLLTSLHSGLYFMSSFSWSLFTFFTSNSQDQEWIADLNTERQQQFPSELHDRASILASTVPHCSHCWYCLLIVLQCPRRRAGSMSSVPSVFLSAVPSR